MALRRVPFAPRHSWQRPAAEAAGFSVNRGLPQTMALILRLASTTMRVRAIGTETCVGVSYRAYIAGFTFVLSSAALRPAASFTASSMAQKCMKNSLGDSSSIWL